MNITVLLTTWNRPKLLEQALRHIERECADIDAPLVIADDQSDNYQTLKIIEEAAKRGIDVEIRKWGRTANDNPHFSLGFHAIHSFSYVIKKYNPEYIIKLDDDCVLSKGAFRCMIKAYQEAVDDGYEVIACSGIQGIYEHQTFAMEGRSYCLIDHPCAVACLYPAYHFNLYLKNTPHSEIATSGWDHKFLDFKEKWFPSATFANTFPFDVAFHASYNGTHLANAEINRPGKFCESIEGIIRE